MTERIDVYEIDRRGIFHAMWRGRTLVNRTPTPLLDSARELLAKGITGGLEMWGVEMLGADPPKLRMSADIEEAAKLTVKEDGGTGPRFVKIRSEPSNSPKGGREAAS
jgi:hypothetical protein